VEESASYLVDGAGATAADRFLDAILDQTAMLAGMPRVDAICRLTHPALKDLRRLPVSGFEDWLLFYRPTNNGIRDHPRSARRQRYRIDSR
jgi:toxin ParE1/3/4